MRIYKFLCFSCLFALALATHHRKKFDSITHALKVFGHSYYNPMTRKPLVGRIDDQNNTAKFPFHNPKMVFEGLPCACVDENCGCCAGLNISTINFDRRFCANFTVNSSVLTVDMEVYMNDDMIFKTNLSARNPPPVCVPLPYVPVIDFCLRLYDLTLPGDNTFQTCLDFEARLTLSPLLIMHFNCIRVGNNSLVWVRPGDDEGSSNTTLFTFNLGSNSNTTSTTVATSQQQQQAADIFDPVDFESADSIVSGDGIEVVGGTTLSPEEEDKIGEHRVS